MNEFFLLQDTAKPINGVGGASVVTSLRKGKKHCTAAVRDGKDKM